LAHIVYIALGTNLGERLANLRAAIAAFPPDLQKLDESPVYETEPWGYADQPPFLNMILRVATELSPHHLLDHLKGIESTLGRVSSFRNGPRLIDLDILFYDDIILETPALAIPHPRLHKRAFVLIPLAQIAPGLVHPVFGLSVAQLLETVDRRGVNLFQG
jgi:2-amino-4-hydroxy-6-hydroxymethyldihydropteridine diphosphokinase